MLNKREVKNLINESTIMINKLCQVVEKEEQLKSDISYAIDGVIKEDVLGTLDKIPIEELNRSKKGIRVRLLQEYGFEYIGDVYRASVNLIASIPGISENKAIEIKNYVLEVAEKIESESKITLSIDKKTSANSSLIYLVTKLIKGQEYITDCKKIYREVNSNMEEALYNILPATSSIKWFFASKAKKEKAIEAYKYLANTVNESVKEKVSLDLNKINEIMQNNLLDAWEFFEKNPITFTNVIENINPKVVGSNSKEYGLPEQLATAIQKQCFYPEGLFCELRRYQEIGVKYILHQERVLLGDEMGLGKTVQAIAAIVSLRNVGATHFIVICPASVLSNWCREIKKMSSLLVTKIHGKDRHEAFNSWLITGGVAVTTYETTSHIQFQNDFKCSLVVVDEAHYIKNENAKRTQNVHRICRYADRILFMTGTALENRVEEMISLINVLQPQIAKSVKGLESLSSALVFRNKVAPVYFRRKREDVLTELPELIENQEWCVMTALEEKRYEEALHKGNFADVRRVSWHIEDLKYSSKALRLLEIIKEAEREGRKVIVFSFFLDTIFKLNELIEHNCYGPINGSVSPAKRQEIIDNFDNAPAGSVLLAQIQAGGTGLNIQSASVVIICEPQFKPSIENQAISRAYRMGQTRNVLVYRLLSENTIDERITRLLYNKQQVFDAFADDSVSANETNEISDYTFNNMIQEEINRIKQKEYNN